MKILFLTKRQYTQKDLLDDKFGRLYELPKGLARHHQIQGICLSYRPRAEGWFYDSQVDEARLAWLSVNLGYGLLPGLWRWYRQIDRVIRQFRPEVLYACADCLQIIVGAHFAKRYGVPLFVDLYDNFESFGASRLIGVMTAFKQAVNRAEGITCISRPLAEYVRSAYGVKRAIQELENAIPIARFYPLDKIACRRRLNLPEQARIIGTAGALYQNRGIDVLYRSFLQLAEADSDLHLVLAGPYQTALPPPNHQRVHYLGVLANDAVVQVVNALDVAVICNLDSEFGRYCFPQKLYEFLACKVPVAAADVGVVADLFTSYPQCLYHPGDHDSLSAALTRQLTDPSVIDLPVSTWPELAEKLSRFLVDTLVPEQSRA